MIRKCFVLVLAVILALFGTIQPALAGFDWASMSEEEIRTELLAGQNELLSRNEQVFAPGSPCVLNTDSGSFIFTLDDVRRVEADDYLRSAYGNDVVVFCVRAVCENISYSDYVANYEIQQLLKVVDQDGFSFLILNYTGISDGRYEVGAHTGVGEKRRVSLTYIGYTDTTCITVTMPGASGSVEYHFD